MGSIRTSHLGVYIIVHGLTLIEIKWKPSRLGMWVDTLNPGDVLKSLASLNVFKFWSAQYEANLGQGKDQWQMREK